MGKYARVTVIHQNSVDSRIFKLDLDISIENKQLVTGSRIAR